MKINELKENELEQVNGGIIRYKEIEKYLTEEGELYGENSKTMWNGNPILPMYY